MHDWSRRSTLSQSRVPLYEKYITVIYALGSAHEENAVYVSAAAPTSHSAVDPAEFNVVCRSKSNLPNRIDSNAALLPYLTHQLGSAHEWSRVWNWPKFFNSLSPEIQNSESIRLFGKIPSFLVKYTLC